MRPHFARPRPKPWVENKQTIRFLWLKPLVFLEWIWAWLAHLLSNWAFLEVLEYAGTFSILVVVVLYFVEAPDRAKQKHYQAWQVINTAQGKGGNGGRIDALQELNHDHIPLVGVNAAGAFLGGLHLENAHLVRANFEAADLRGCNLAGSDLEDASLKEANFRNSDLRSVNLKDADLTDADLENTNLSKANVRGADFSKADLHLCDLKDMQWEGIDGIKFANIFHVKNAPAGFVAWALAHGAVEVESDSEWMKMIGEQK